MLKTILIYYLLGLLSINIKNFYKKSVQDGIKDSFAHMSPARGDAPQGTFFEVYGNLVNDFTITIKKYPEFIFSGYFNIYIIYFISFDILKFFIFQYFLPAYSFPNTSYPV